MNSQNFLLGKGERLTEDIVVKGGGGPKKPPYSFSEARKRLAPMLGSALDEIDALPEQACPADEAVLALTLNPEYIAKSYFPGVLLRSIDLEVVGSRPRRVIPEKRSEKRTPEETNTTELFVAGKRSSFRRWKNELPDWTASRGESADLIKIEQISALSPKLKIKGILPAEGMVTFEVVLHSDEFNAENRYLKDFQDYLQFINIKAEFGRRFFAGGLCFLELTAPAEKAEDIATFSIVRVLRQMPALRMLCPAIRSSQITSKLPEFPAEGPIDSDVRVAIFDGGIPIDHPITEWATPYETQGIGASCPKLYQHGIAVTSAFLFGHLDPIFPIQRPFANADHYRVIDTEPGQDPYELYEILDRIEQILVSVDYDFINLSLGPSLPIEDDDVHAWTAVLDDRLSRIPALAAIAVGNEGEGDSDLGFDRIQVPSDCVNALSIGAADSPDKEWQRAPYSSVGPGRSPGVVKPDLTDFGGVMQRPFLVLSKSGSELVPTAGTSFSTPSVLRMAAGIRAYFGGNLNHLAIRTLLIHTAEQGTASRSETGWGRVARSLSDIVVCGNDTVRLVYQGEISPSKYIRAPIPLPDKQLTGMVSVSASLCYKSKTDPHHPGNYTRAGLEITFRPHDGKFSRDNQLHPDSKPFFGSASLGLSEVDLRKDAWKWENCLNASQRFRGASLKRACFDIHYNARLEGRNFLHDQELPYALVVTVRAKNIVDLYDQILRKYATQLVSLRPVVQVPIQT